MKGLLLKDWFVLWKQGRWMLLLSVLYAVIAVVGDNLFFVGFTVLFLSMLPITALGFDERSHWDRYALTMPYTRRQIVCGKYLLSLIGMAAAALLYILLAVGVLLFSDTPLDIAGLALVLGTMLAIGFLFSALNFPIMFKLGVEKGRLWFILITVGLILFVGVWNALVEERVASDALFGTLADSAGSLIPEMTLAYGVFLVLSPLLFLLSLPMSVRLYEKREL